VREGAVGPLVFEFAAQRVWAMRPGRPSPPVWLLMRRSLEATPEVKDYISNGDTETPLGVLASVAWSRFRVEEFFEDCKSYSLDGPELPIITLVEVRSRTESKLKPAAGR
jgi:hypothetical protein